MVNRKREVIAMREHYSKPALQKTSNVTSDRKRNVWLYMVDGRNDKDLAKLDAEGFDTWRGNPKTEAGDLILMYRTAPYSDIAYVFVALGNAYKTNRSPAFPWENAVDLGDGFRLRRVIKLHELRNEPSLKSWGFLKILRGATSRKDDLRAQGIWRALQNILETRDSGFSSYLDRWASNRDRDVFLSYASPDKREVDNLYLALSRSGLDVWLDRNELKVGEKFNVTIREKINSSAAVVVCLSKAWLKKKYAQKELRWAMERARDHDNFLFPVQIEGCHIPKSLKKFAHVPRLTGRNKDAELKTLCSLLRAAH
jgi:TIR domain